MASLNTETNRTQPTGFSSGESWIGGFPCQFFRRFGEWSGAGGFGGGGAGCRGGGGGGGYIGESAYEAKEPPCIAKIF